MKGQPRKRPALTDATSYYFPESVRKGMKFMDMSVLYTIIRQEAVAKHIDYKHGDYMVSNFRSRIKLQCKQCDALIRCQKLADGSIEVIELLTYHNHQKEHELATISSEESSGITKSFYQEEETQSTQIMAQKVQKFYIAEQQSEVKKSTHDSSFLQWLEEEGSVLFKTRVEWDSSESLVPSFMVVATVSMEINFKKFGRHVCLVLLPQQKFGVEVGVFTVQDSNMRVLLAGVAILSELNVKLLEGAFTEFMDIHKCHSFSLLTINHPAFVQVLSKMKKQKLFGGTHLLDAPTILSNDAFVGLREQQLAAATKAVQEALAGCSTHRQLLQRVIRLDDTLVNQSLTQFEPWLGDSGLIEKDLRLAEIVKCFESKVVARFLKNYSLGLDCNIVREESLSPETHSYLMKQRSTGKQVQIINWVCECFELEKTGVGCCHILAAARLEPIKSYMGLIDWRWRRQPQQK